MAPKIATGDPILDRRMDEETKANQRDAKKMQDFNRGMAGAVERPLLDNILLHIAIRVKYLINTWFCLIPLFSSDLSGYKSPYRPKGIPELDYWTKFAIRWTWFIGSSLRKFRLVTYFCIKIRLLHAVNAFYTWIMVSNQKKHYQNIFEKCLSLCDRNITFWEKNAQNTIFLQYPNYSYFHIDVQ